MINYSHKCAVLNYAPLTNNTAGLDGVKKTADECGFHKVVFVPLLDMAVDGKEEEHRKELWDIKLSTTTSGSRRGGTLHSVAVGQNLNTEKTFILLYFINCPTTFYVGFIARLQLYSTYFGNYWSPG